MYVGANDDAIVAALINADPNDDLPVLLGEINTLNNTSYPARARAMAREIKATRPHFVGLQEVSKIDVSIPSQVFPPGIEVHIDFLPVLLDELAAAGLNYVLAGSVLNFTVLLSPGFGVSIGLQDSDALLVDADNASFNPATVVAKKYQFNLGEVVPGLLVLERGFVMIDAVVDGVPLKVASTHLEPDIFGTDLSMLRAAQMQELLGNVGTAPRAVIVGDLNDVEGSPMYQAATGNGFLDAWDELRWFADGLTCCYPADLSNPTSRGFLQRRIDFIFVRGLGYRNNHLVGLIGLLGTLPFERIPGPNGRIWPSNHAGLAATFLQPKSHN
jgi:hypothetical protein